MEIRSVKKFYFLPPLTTAILATALFLACSAPSAWSGTDGGKLSSTSGANGEGWKVIETVASGSSTGKTPTWLSGLRSTSNFFKTFSQPCSAG